MNNKHKELVAWLKRHNSLASVYFLHTVAKRFGEDWLKEFEIRHCLQKFKVIAISTFINKESLHRMNSISGAL